MKINSIAIIHYHPLELYPPVLNFLSCLKNFKNIKSFILTTKWNYNYNINYLCFRLGIFSKNRFLRYFSYIQFNIVGLIVLLLKRPKSIIYFETLSVFPVYIYKLLFRNVKILVHFHEYTTIVEYNTSSLYYRFLYRCECELFNKVSVISHTNNDRLNLFIADNVSIENVDFVILPNYPPLNWYKYFNRSNRLDNLIKFVYVGSISLDTMHLKLFANYIKSQSDKVVWNIYSNNYEPSVKKFFLDLQANNIILHTGVQYDYLPDILSKHDIGVILYNGNMPNYIFNVPNKLLEYYSCGLKILCSSDLISSLKFKKENNLTSIIPIDFKNSNCFFKIIEILNFKINDSKIFNCENIYNIYIKKHIII
jgi:hypothetical protein